MSKKLIAVDLCNTISNVNAQLVKYDVDFGLYPGNFPEGFWSSSEGLRIFSKADPMDGAIKAVGFLQNYFQGDVVYVTKRPPESKFVTRRWLEVHGFPDGDLVFCDDKVPFFKNSNLCAVMEDDPVLVKQAHDCGNLVFMHLWPYNQHVEGANIVRVSHWRQIVVYTHLTCG